jgi:hypothetical protein
MIREMNSLWYPYDVVASDRCWHCHVEFTKDEFLRVIDSVVPKLVHDRQPCAVAMVRMPTVPQP